MNIKLQSFHEGNKNFERTSSRQAHFKVPQGRGLLGRVQYVFPQQYTVTILRNSHAKEDERKVLMWQFTINYLILTWLK